MSHACASGWKLCSSVLADLPLRLTLVEPPKDVAFALRRDKHDLVQPARRDDTSMSFDVSVSVKGTKPDGSPNLLGPNTQRRPYGRILVINVGTLAGQADSCWTRAVLVPLAGISWELIEQTLATPDAVLEARVPGTGRDGTPSCATVRLQDGWQVRPRKA
jgi:hypothetical protein